MVLAPTCSHLLYFLSFSLKALGPFQVLREISGFLFSSLPFIFSGLQTSVLCTVTVCRLCTLLHIDDTPT